MVSVENITTKCVLLLLLVVGILVMVFFHGTSSISAFKLSTNLGKDCVKKQRTSRIRSRAKQLRAAREQHQQRISFDVNNANGETGAAGGGNVVVVDSVDIVHTVAEPVVSSSSSTKRRFDLLDGAQMPAVDTDSVESSSVNSDGDRMSESDKSDESDITDTDSAESSSDPVPEAECPVTDDSCIIMQVSALRNIVRGPSLTVVVTDARKGPVVMLLAVCVDCDCHDGQWCRLLWVAAAVLVDGFSMHTPTPAPAILTPANVKDISVSYDASWVTRCHKSVFGFGCVVDFMTNVIIDFAVLSTYCHGCATRGDHMDKTTREYDLWLADHSRDKNFEGTAGAMDASIAEILWKRSVAFVMSPSIRMAMLNVYSDACSIQKEECVNHISKRLFTALRKVAGEGRREGVVTGGKGFGKLTAVTIDKLTRYYGLAIRRHVNNLPGMVNAVFATFEHAVSTDDQPQHDRCPKGCNSWCFYQSAISKSEQPGPHRIHVHPPISRAIAHFVKPLYIRLGEEILLKSFDNNESQRPMPGLSFDNNESQRPMPGLSIDNNESQRPMPGLSFDNNESQRPMPGLRTTCVPCMLYGFDVFMKCVREKSPEMYATANCRKTSPPQFESHTKPDARTTCVPCMLYRFGVFMKCVREKSPEMYATANCRKTSPPQFESHTKPAASVSACLACRKNGGILVFIKCIRDTSPQTYAARNCS
ncbi:hypothetical protein LSAT2_011300 [Lamellibrachia satsuma]|nr:hypothetical protein LSAT2_011300 [Lamellibrachia satsuma]